MFKEKEKLIDDMVKSISNLGINEQGTWQIEKCFHGETEEEEVYKVLGDVEISQINYTQGNKIEKSLKELKNQEDKELLEKYVRILFYICKELFFDKYYMKNILGRYAGDIYKNMQQYNIPFYSYVLYRANIMQDQDNMCKDNIKELEKLYAIDRDQFILAYKNAQNAAKIFLGTVGAIKNDEFVEGLETWVENCIIHNFKILLKSFKLNEDYINTVVEHVKGKDTKLNEIAEVLKSNFDENAHDYFTSRFIIITSYITCEKYEISRRILKLLILTYSNHTFTQLAGYIKSSHYVYYDNSDRKLQKINESITELIDLIDVPKEYYLAFMAEEYIDKKALYFKNCIEDIFNVGKEIVKKAISLCDGLGKIILSSCFWKVEEGSEFINIAEEKFLNSFMEIFQLEEGFSNDNINDFCEYLSGNKEIDQVRFPKNFKNRYISTYKYEKVFRLLFLMKDNSNMFDRTINYIVELGNGNIFKSFAIDFLNFLSKNENDLLEVLRKLNIKMDKYLPLLTYAATEGYNKNIKAKMDVLLNKLLVVETEAVLECIGLCDANGREYWIEKISKEYSNLNVGKEKYDNLLVNFAGDSSKSVREIVFKYIALDKECISKVVPLLDNKKAQIRESAVKILGEHINEDYKKLLEDRLEKEKSSKVKNLIMEYLNIEEQGENEENINIFEYCRKNLNKRKKAAVDWLKPLELPKLKLKDSKECISEEVLYYLLISFAENKDVKLNLDAKKIASNIDEASLKDFAFEVLNKWINEGAEAKKKWVLSAGAMFGDNRVVDMLYHYIKKWTENSRGALASEAVKALALQGSDEALMLVDSIGRKIKHRQVKKAAGEALKFAAQELGIDPEELGDKLVSKLDFDENGQRVFDYGNRKFTVEVTPELKLSVFKEDGKQLKNLPAVGKNDNEETAVRAREEFKLLKKQLKTLVTAQTDRLENALSINRKWTSDKWKKLFVDNVIMQRFALGLIWGVYKENNLIQSFRYMDDGTFNTVDEEEYILPKEAEIGLIHPIELTEEEIEAWSEQLEDYEIKQPFEQLGRKVFRMDEEEKDKREVQGFGGIILNEYQMMKFEKLSWNKGEILDAGGYYEFYKENLSLDLTAEIRHSGLCVGYFMDEDVTIHDIVFYKTGDNPDSYWHDNNKCLQLKNVPERFFSEIMYDVYKLTLNNNGKNEDWKKKLSRYK